MTIKLHHLRPAVGAKKEKVRVGRGEGGKRGKTAGRGTKGTKARKNVPAAFEGGQMPLHMRLPKLKGFTSRNRVEYQVVNVGDLARLFPQGGTVGTAELVAAGAVRRNQRVKVLGDGELGSVAVQVNVDKVSRSAAEKITAAGGSVDAAAGGSVDAAAGGSVDAAAGGSVDAAAGGSVDRWMQPRAARSSSPEPTPSWHLTPSGPAVTVGRRRGEVCHRPRKRRTALAGRGLT